MYMVHACNCGALNIFCRFFDGMYYNNYYRQPAYPSAAASGRGGSAGGGYSDRNWYYQPDTYDDRYRYGGGAVDRNQDYGNR